MAVARRYSRGSKNSDFTTKPTNTKLPDEKIYPHFDIGFLDSIKTKLILIMVAVAAIPLIVAVIVSYNSSTNKAKEDAPKTHTAVIVCPGGSYHHLGLKSEGNTTATWFSENGVTAFVLKYRTAESLYHYPAMLEDIQLSWQ